MQNLAIYEVEDQRGFAMYDLNCDTGENFVADSRNVESVMKYNVATVALRRFSDDFGISLCLWNEG